MQLSEIMLPEFDREMARTRRVLAALPAEHMSWQAHQNLHTIGWNANHLVDIVSWTPSIIAQDEFDIAPIDGPKQQPSAITDPGELLAEYDRQVAAGRAVLAGTSDVTMAEEWSLKQGGQTLFTISKGECLRTWVLNHSMHHRGILSVYLRMCGVDIVPVYDE